MLTRAVYKSPASPIDVRLLDRIKPLHGSPNIHRLALYTSPAIDDPRPKSLQTLDFLGLKMSVNP